MFKSKHFICVGLRLAALLMCFPAIAVQLPSEIANAIQITYGNDNTAKIVQLGAEAYQTAIDAGTTGDARIYALANNQMAIFYDCLFSSEAIDSENVMTFLQNVVLGSKAADDAFSIFEENSEGYIASDIQSRCQIK